MELNKKNIDELIARYLSGEADPEDAISLDAWRVESAANSLYFDECARVMTGRKLNVTDTKKMYRKVLSEIGAPAQEKGRMFFLSAPGFAYRAAAAVLLFSVIGISLYVFNSKGSVPEVIASSETSKQQMLADGSGVFLNKGTKLTLAGGFNKKERRMKLEGEAFFEVRHDDEKPFVIEVGGLEVRDIGTAFNIKAKPGSDSVTVFVQDGIVDLSNGPATLRLKKDESGLYIRSKNILVQVTDQQQNAIAYKTHAFRFRGTTLQEVVTLLNEVYGNRIILENPALANCRITVEFTNESIETILGVVTETLELNYQKTGDGFVIKGTECVQ